MNTLLLIQQYGIIILLLLLVIINPLLLHRISLIFTLVVPHHIIEIVAFN